MACSRPDPEWDWKDRHIMREWGFLHDRLCPQCKRPLVAHQADFDEFADAPDPIAAAATNYRVTALVCPATVAIDWVQNKLQESDKAAHAEGLQPERARTFVSIHKSEPDFKA